MHIDKFNHYLRKDNESNYFYRQISIIKLQYIITKCIFFFYYLDNDLRIEKKTHNVKNV